MTLNFRTKDADAVSELTASPLGALGRVSLGDQIQGSTPELRRVAAGISRTPSETIIAAKLVSGKAGQAPSVLVVSEALHDTAAADVDALRAELTDALARHW